MDSLSGFWKAEINEQPLKEISKKIDKGRTKRHKKNLGEMNFINLARRNTCIATFLL
jgi:hypothetical protein